ncbi:YciY family protein [Photorhabdus africana]|uniref:YciY family protein n=1 Tax=Photorhabdus africana TaxID=3097554 RepID=UPI002B412ADE|nr:YciY family protein [Photorhabdus sp. CRI-LC]
MKRSRNEVGRWRMLRQNLNRRRRWLEGQSRRNLRIYSLRKLGGYKQRRALLFVQHGEWIH